MANVYPLPVAANIEVIGRGPAYGGAIMGALCIREMTGQRAAPHSGGGFRHGPLLDVNDSHVAIILALGRTAALGVSLSQDCLARGGRVILVETEERQRSERLLPIKIDSVPETLGRPYVSHGAAGAHLGRRRTDGRQTVTTLPVRGHEGVAPGGEAFDGHKTRTLKNLLSLAIPSRS